MKKWLFLLLILLVITACNSNNDQQETKPDETESPNEEENTDNQTEEVFSDLVIDTKLNVQQTNQKLLFDIQLLNQTDSKHEVTFNSGQKFDVFVEDQSGQELYRYSEGKMFTQAIEKVVLKGGEKISWQDEWELPEELNAETLTVTAKVKVSKFNGKEVTDQSKVTAEQTVRIGNNAFRNVKVTGNGGNYVIQGEARVFEGVFYYAVEDGHEYVIDETKVNVSEGAPTWSTFEITVDLPEEQLPENGTLSIELYELSAENGLPANLYNTQLDEIN